MASLTGCGVGDVDTSQRGTVVLSGRVLGGQQPLANAHIYIYQPGLTGSGNGANGSAATLINTQSVLTDANGQFNLANDFTCADSTAQAYMVAAGGNPGLPVVGGVTPYNASIIMVAALGRCGNLFSPQYVEINELTTVAAAWALGPFYAAYDHIGTSSTNKAGMANAFANAQMLVDVHTGQVANLGANRVVETGKLYALANAVASCVNSDGSGCSPFFSAATVGTGAQPTNTMDAAVNVTRNPSNDVGQVFSAQGSFPPFPGTLTGPPNDWTMSLTVTGGGLSSPATVGIDANGYIWVADYAGALSEFDGQGNAQTQTGYGVGSLSESYGLAISPTTGYVWVTNAEAPYHYPTEGSVYIFNGSNQSSPGVIHAGPYNDVSINYPTSVTLTAGGYGYVNDYYGNAATGINPGVGFTGGFGSGSSSFPVAVAADAQSGVWIANNSDTTITHVSSSGTVLAHPSCCDGADGLAVDATGSVWVANYYSTSISEVSAAGSVVLNQVTGGGISYPNDVVVDGAQNVWFANYHGASISEFAGNANTTPAPGTPLSPSTGYGRDTTLVLPYGIGVDNSGDVWVSSFNNSKLIEFIGLAAPTKTPLTPTPAAP